MNININNREGGYFGRSRSQKFKYRQQLKLLLRPAIQYAKQIGLEPKDLKFVEKEEREDVEQEGESFINLSIERKTSIVFFLDLI